MLIMVDECLPNSLVLELRGRGHDVVWAREAYPGDDDEKILSVATAEGRILLTEDRDFGTLTVRQKRPTVGIVIAHASRFAGTPADIAIRIANALGDLGDKCLGALTVIEPDRVRQRPLPQP